MTISASTTKVEKKVWFAETSSKIDGFVDTFPKVDKAAQLPDFDDEKFRTIFVQMQELFRKYKEQKKKTPNPRLAREVNEILKQMNVIPENFSLQVARIVACRMGAHLSHGFSCSRESNYLDEADRFQLMPPVGLTGHSVPWWYRLDRYWLCFFTQQQLLQQLIHHNPNSSGMGQDELSEIEAAGATRRLISLTAEKPPLSQRGILQK